MVHVRDYSQWNPVVCSYPSNLDYGVMVRDDNDKERNQSEMNAYPVSVACLQKLLDSQTKTCDECYVPISNILIAHKKYLAGYAAAPRCSGASCY